MTLKCGLCSFISSKTSQAFKAYKALCPINSRIRKSENSGIPETPSLPVPTTDATRKPCLQRGQQAGERTTWNPHSDQRFLLSVVFINATEEKKGRTPSNLGLHHAKEGQALIRQNSGSSPEVLVSFN